MTTIILDPFPFNRLQKKLPSTSSYPFTSVQFDSFKQELKRLIDFLESGQAQSETEEQLKNEYIAPLFKLFGYETKRAEIDLLVEKNSLFTIIETKKAESDEIVKLLRGNWKSKALIQSIRYYYILSTREEKHVMYVILTDGKRWIIMNTGDYRKYFYKEKKFERFVGIYSLFSKDKTAKEFDEAVEKYLETEKITLRGYYFELSNSLLESEEKVKVLYDFFKNLHELGGREEGRVSLNRKFYDELLYVLGLEEKRESGEVFIVNTNVKNTLYDLIREKLEYLTGSSPSFEEVISYVILWLNRILFLKVFERILVSANGNDPAYKFLTREKVQSWAGLNDLFFEVLAKQEESCDESISKKFGNVPYLNSSLFELHPIEHALRISDLPGERELKLKKDSVLKTKEKKEELSSLKTFEYLLEFLSRYEFYETEEEAEQIISPAVLGLVFEKLNGYRDGSYYTKPHVTGRMVTRAIDTYLLESLRERGYELRHILCSFAFLTSDSTYYYSCIHLCKQTIMVMLL